MDFTNLDTFIHSPSTGSIPVTYTDSTGTIHSTWIRKPGHLTWGTYPEDLIDKINPEIKKANVECSVESTPEGLSHMLVCCDKIDLSPEYILKNLSIFKGKLMLDIAPIDVYKFECYITPVVKDNLIRASKRLEMYGKKRPYIARFDDYGRRLPDEITIDSSKGITLHIIDPADYGEFYFALKVITFYKSKATTETLFSDEFIPF